MTKFFFAAALTLAALPALAQEGNGDFFANRVPGVTTATASLKPDVGSASYPDVAGRPGASLFVSATEVAGLANEAPVQTANSQPNGFTAGTAAFASVPTRERFAALGR